ncbi:MAG TPA: hypothetical protein ENJ92_01180 [Chloroflexi bacterium]|nr:hypothetical protein [Chloroflexota bacterium]
MSKLTPAGKFWLSYFLFLFLIAMSGISWADPAASSGSTSGALSGAQSQAGSIGLIDSSVNTVEADDGSRAVRGVFAAGVTAGGSNPCVVSIGGGLSVPGGGINFANAYNDGECNVRETLRLMAAISSSAEAGNQILLREISCQSVTIWDAFERTFNKTGDERYFCESERPENKDRFIAGRIRHAATGGSRNVAYDLDGGNPVKHRVVSSMLSQDLEEDAWSMLMTD